MTAEDEDLARIAAELPARYAEAMSRLDYAGALEAAWDLVKRTNRYIEEAAPWNLAKNDDTRGRLEAVLYRALEAVRIAALFTAPVMPRTSAEVWRRLGIDRDPAAVRDLDAEAAWGGLTAGQSVTKGDPLFPRIQDGEEA